MYVSYNGKNENILSSGYIWMLKSFKTGFFGLGFFFSFLPHLRLILSSTQDSGRAKIIQCVYIYILFSSPKPFQGGSGPVLWINVRLMNEFPFVLACSTPPSLLHLLSLCRVISHDIFLPSPFHFIFFLFCSLFLYFSRSPRPFSSSFFLFNRST